MSTPRVEGRLTAVMLLLAAAVGLTACGGGSDQAPDSQRTPDGTQLEGAACLDCRAGYLSGVVASGGPWADAEVRIVDAQGRVAVGRTDTRGRYEVAVAQLSGSLLVQATGLVGGKPRRLHGACRGAEIGNRAVNVTPLTELLVAQALGERPERLLLEARVDFFRLDANGLQQAEAVVERLVRPVLDLTGVPAQVDLRVTPFEANHKGLDGALALLQLTPAAPGYRLDWAGPVAGTVANSGATSVATSLATAAPARASLNLQPGAMAAALPLPAVTADAAAASLAALSAIAAIETRLGDLSRLFADGLPDASMLRSQLAANFLDGGLDASVYTEQVLLRQDAVDAGGYSLRGARWHDARLLEVVDARTVLVRMRLSAPATRVPQFEDMWWIQQDGRWLLAGDRSPARAAVRNLNVLAPRALTESAVRQLPGALCPAAFDLLSVTGIDERCRIDGGQTGVALGGLLDLGLPDDGHFGALGLYRSFAELPQERLHAYMQRSQLLAAPSERIERQIVFELDARRSDRRATQARVTGPGLPAAGLLLVRPPARAGAPTHEHWVWSDDSGDLWNGIALGWCQQATDTAQTSACRQAWTSVQAGSRYRFELLDAQGQGLGSVETSLPDTPAAEDKLAAAVPALFARFDISNQPALQPRLALLAAPAPAPADGQADAGQSLAVQLPWRTPSDARQVLVEAQVDWWRASFVATANDELLRWRQPLPALGSAPASPSVTVQFAARAGWHSRWLAARIFTQDPMGNRYLHFVAPNNPY